jgi:hypothetical protein
MSDVALEAARQRLLLGQNLKWWKGDKARLSRENINELRNDFNIEYRHGRFYNLRPQTQKSVSKVGGMPKCTNCIAKGVVCSGPTNPSMQMCTQCAVDGLNPEECVYLNDSLKLSLPAWYGRGAGGGGGGGGGASALNVPIQPAVPNRTGAGLAIRRPTERGSPTGMEYENANEENEVNSINSNDPNATEEEIAASKAKKNKRRAAVAKLLANSALTNANNNLAAGDKSAKAVRAMAKAAGGGGGKHSRTNKRKNLKRKQKQTRKQK